MVDFEVQDQQTNRDGLRRSRRPKFREDMAIPTA